MSLFEAGLVAAVWVEGEVSEKFACFGVDDSDIEVVDDEDHGRVFVGAADADVVHSSCSAEADGAT